MTVQRGEGDRRWIEVEVEVPGTPEEVWAAIATSQGVSSWFGDTKSDECEGGDFVGGMWPGMESTSTIITWNPPDSFSMELPPAGEGIPKFAAEWIVQAKSGDSCVVRLVQSLFTSGDDWDDQLENMESGWPKLLAMLRLYLTHFRGMAGASAQLLRPVANSEHDVWSEIQDAFGLTGRTVGERFETTREDAPAISGFVEEIGTGDDRTALLRLDGPADGMVWVGAFTFNGMVMIGVRLFHFGEGASQLAAQQHESWQAWLDRMFPTPQAEATP